MLKELINEKYDEIVNTMVECYTKSLQYQGRTTYRIYLWSDGAIETLEEVGYPSGYLKPKDFEQRELYWLVDVRADAEDYVVAMEGVNEDDEEEVEVAIHEAVKWWEENVLPFELDQMIENAERFDIE